MEIIKEENKIETRIKQEEKDQRTPHSNKKKKDHYETEKMRSVNNDI